MTNAIQKLCELLEKSGTVVTFSKNCISGLVTDCACKRCMVERGETPTEETEARAEARSRIESDKFRKRCAAPTEGRETKNK